MQLEQTFTLGGDPAAVWKAFHDVALLVDCLPGASIRDEAPADADGGVPLLFKVKLGPIAAAFSGQGRLTLDEAAQTGTFAGHAVDARSNSRVKGEARFSVLPDEAAGTRVSMTVDYTITGMLAQFSREGIVRALADQLTGQFATALQERLPADTTTPTEAPAQPSSAATGVPVAEDDGLPPDLVNVAAAVGVPTATGTPHDRTTTRPPRHADTLDVWTLIKAWLRGLMPGSRG